MGVDIHTFLSYKDNDIWKMVPVYTRDTEDDSIDFAEMYSGRHTEFFEWMLGNRNELGYGDFPDEIANRGIGNIAPDGVPSYVLRRHSMVRNDIFGESYITLAEIRGILKRMPKKITYTYEDGDSVKESNEIRDSLKTLKRNIESALSMSGTYCPDEDVRLYYWFDN